MDRTTKIVWLAQTIERERARAIVRERGLRRGQTRRTEIDREYDPHTAVELANLIERTLFPKVAQP